MALTKVTHSMVSTPADTASNIADATAAINTADKYEGQYIWDITNKRLLRAAGDIATSDWDVVDGSASVTPA